MTLLFPEMVLQVTHHGDQAHQAGRVQGGLPAGDLYKRVRRNIVGPGGGELPEALLVIDEVEHVLVPYVPVLDHLEFSAGKWMEGVDYPEPADSLPAIGCT